MVWHNVTNLSSPEGTDSCLTPDEEWQSHDESGAQRHPCTAVPKGRTYGRFVACEGCATINPSLSGLLKLATLCHGEIYGVMTELKPSSKYK